MKYFSISALSQVHAENGGQAILRPGWVHPKRNLITSVVIMGLKGQVFLKIDGEKIVLDPGRIVLMPAGLLHEGTSPLEESSSYLWLHFSMPQPSKILNQEEAEMILNNQEMTKHLLADSALLPLEYKLSEVEPHLSLFREILNLQETPSYTNLKFQILFQQLLINLTEMVIRAHKSIQEPPSSSIVYGVLKYVAENLIDPNLSIKSIARELNFNLDYTGRSFKRVMGISVGDYILKQRMGLAKLQLEKSSDSLSIVAQSSGYGSLRHFLRQFKNHYGLTPTEYRNKYYMMHINSL